MLDLYYDRVSALSRELGILFLGLVPDPSGMKSKGKCKLYCRLSGIYWETTNVSNYLHNRRCPCAVCSNGRRNSKMRVITDLYPSVEDTYWSRVQTLADELGLLFLGFNPKKKDKTKTTCKFFCKEHKVYWETTSLGNFLHRKTNPCKTCSGVRAKIPLQHSVEEYLPKLLTVCDKLKTEFIGWEGGYRGAQSKFSHKCLLHGVITKSSHSRSFVEGRSLTSGCSACHKLQFRKSIIAKTSIHVNAFIATGKYAEGTIFLRNEHKKTTQGVKAFWDVTCGNCEETNTVFIGTLKKGSLSCSCKILECRMGYYPARHDWDDNLYLLRYVDLDEGTFYKIGRSFDIKVRISNLRAVYKDITIIGVYKNKHYAVFNEEGRLHREVHNNRYTPWKSFGGAGECFTEECINNLEVKETFNL